MNPSCWSIGEICKTTRDVQFSKCDLSTNYWNFLKQASRQNGCSFTTQIKQNMKYHNMNHERDRHARSENSTLKTRTEAHNIAGVVTYFKLRKRRQGSKMFS